MRGARGEWTAMPFCFCACSKLAWSGPLVGTPAHADTDDTLGNLSPFPVTAVLSWWRAAASLKAINHGSPAIAP